MSKGSNRRPGKGYQDNFKLEGKSKGGSWVQCPETGKLIPRSEYVRPTSKSAYVQGDIEDFVSPITKEVISDRGALRRHNRKHGVTNMADYSAEFIAKKARARDDATTGNTHQAKLERRELISRAIDEGRR